MKNKEQLFRYHKNELTFIVEKKIQISEWSKTKELEGTIKCGMTGTIFMF